MNFLANMTGNKHIKAIAPTLSKLSMGEKMNLLRGKASQDTINKVFKEAPPEQLAKIARNFDNSPSSVNIMKEMAKKIDLKDEGDRNKLTYLAQQANMKDDDIKEILGNLGTNINANKKVSINDISEIIQKHGEPIKDNENTEPKIKINDIDAPNIRDSDIATKLRDMKRTIRKTEKGYKLSQDDKEKFDRTVDELKNTDNGNEDKDEIDKYLNNISDLTNKIKNDATEIIVEFNNINHPDTYNTVNNNNIDCSEQNGNGFKERNHNKFGIKDIDPKYKEKFNMITVVFQEQHKSDNIFNNNKSNCKVYFNGELKSDKLSNTNSIENDEIKNFKSRVMKSNLSKLHINPSKINGKIIQQTLGDRITKIAPLQMSDLTYYNYALNNAEIKNLYKNGFNKYDASFKKRISKSYQKGFNDINSEVHAI